jgi:hypothetical protein
VTDFAEHVGVGRRQPNDVNITDATRTQRIIIPGEHTPNVGCLIVHRSGRVDAVVRPETVHIPRDESLQFKRDHGLDDREMVAVLNRIFGVQARRIQHVR